MIDGKWFIRKRDASTKVLCLVHKGKPTHHLIAKNDAGFLCVNRRQYGEFKNLQQLVTGLAKPGVDGWPTPLSTPVLRKGGSSMKSPPKWQFPESTTREQSEALVGGKPDGSFLVRKRQGQANQYVLCVVYRGKPTQHLIKKNDEGRSKDPALL